MKRSPINPINPKRRKERFKKGYGSEGRVLWIKNKRCCVTGQSGRSGDPIVASHVKSRAAGGTADDVVPMLLSLEKELHNIGIKSFQKKHGVDLAFMAKLYQDAWEKHESEHDTR